MTHRRLALFAITTVLSLSLLSCDLLGSSEEPTTTLTTGVFVANQGQFGQGNGTVSVYAPASDSVAPSAIDGLGTIIQSIALRNDRLYIAANTGARIDVFDAKALTQQKQITGFSGPRYLAGTDDETAYVTDQSFSGPSFVRVVDTDAGTITDSVEVPGSPEGITLTETHAYAALGAFGDTTLVAQIDRSSRTLTTIDVGCRPRYAVADQEDEVFVLCGNTAEAVVLDGGTGTEQSRLSLPDTAETAFGIGQTASFSAGAQELYIATDTGILRVDTEQNALTTTLDVQNAGSIGAILYDATRQELYVARIPSFTERGSVTIHDRDGTRTGSFQVGVAPVYLAVRREQQ
ncbi:MAG: YncE family protein [Salinibacter sp.]